MINGVICLGYLSVIVKRNHDYGNDLKKKVYWRIKVSLSESMVIMVGVIAAS